MRPSTSAGNVRAKHVAAIRRSRTSFADFSLPHESLKSLPAYTAGRPGTASINVEALLFQTRPSTAVETSFQAVDSQSVHAPAQDDDAVEKRRLQVMIFEAKNLPVMDDNMIGTCDPYCKAVYGNKKAETRVKTKSLNPEWNEMLSFQLPLHSEEDLECQVLDWDTDMHDFIGMVTFHIGHKDDALSMSEHRHVDRCISMAGTHITTSVEGWFPILDQDGNYVRGVGGKSMIRLKVIHHLEVRLRMQTSCTCKDAHTHTHTHTHTRIRTHTYELHM
jgi:hypothetical protein